MNFAQYGSRPRILLRAVPIAATKEADFFLARKKQGTLAL
jgi:hypothetical protein